MKNTFRIIIFFWALQTVAQSAHYRMNESVPLPDLSLTPGASSNTTASDLCSTSGSAAARAKVNFDSAVRQRVCTKYGITDSDCAEDKIQIDFVIPRELGGTIDDSNLWPLPTSFSSAKKATAAWLHLQVCKSVIDLQEAQTKAANDWAAEYKKIPEGYKATKTK